MSAITSTDTFERKLSRELAEMRSIIEDLRTNQINVLIVPVLTSDPSSPTNGQVWYNSTSNTFKCRQGGITKTFTTS